MPFNVNSNAVDANNVQTKRGIFRSRTQPPPAAQPVRSKLSSNVAMKANRKKIQSKVLNRKDPSTEPDLKIKRSSTFITDEIASNVVEKPSIQLVQDSLISNVSQTLQASDVVQTLLKDSCEQSQSMVVNSVHSLVFRMENCKLQQTTTTVSNSKTLLTKASCNELEINAFPLVTHPHQTSAVHSFQMDPFQTSHSNGCTDTVPPIDCEKSFRNEKLHANKLTSKKFESCIKNDLPSNKSSNPVVMPVQVNTNDSMLNDVKTLSSASVDQLKIGDNIKLALEPSNADLFVTELKAYQESLKKYDQEAKEVIHKFTESLDEKGKMIRKYEEDLSLFNTRVFSLQSQLEGSLERTKKLESTIESKTTVNCPSADEMKSENVKLKERIKILETKLAKRDLHIFNLKEVLSIETNKMKERNEAQEEINKLQCESISKSREIAILRDELKYAANMRTELVSEYDEKIVKLKKLLAIREYLLMKGKS